MNYLVELFLEPETISTSYTGYVSSLVILLFGILHSFFITRKVRHIATYFKDFQAVLKGMYRIQIALLFRFIISFIDYLIWFFTFGEYSLKGFFESMLWVFVMYYLLMLVWRQQLINFPKDREGRRKHLSRTIITFILILAVGLTINDFYLKSVKFETIMYIFLIITLIFAGILFFREFLEVNKGILRARFIMLNFLFLTGAIYILYTTIFWNFVMLNRFPDGNIDPLYHSIVFIFYNMIIIIISIEFYWFISMPSFIKKRVSRLS
ncbi:MAG: hypothetical protein INQ03_03295 [Candidatus Heimdallarchaeota archaeon]|nr:hypothetical protein [Candidatus Heimdallarchaeota archaeon]